MYWLTHYKSDAHCIKEVFKISKITISLTINDKL